MVKFFTYSKPHVKKLNSSGQKMIKKENILH